VRHSRARRALSAAVGGVLVAGTATACFDDASAMPAVRDFLIAWQVGNYPAAARHTIGADRRTVATMLGQVRDQLDAASMKLGLGWPTQEGKKPLVAISKSGEEAEARFSVKIDLGENGEPFYYGGQMRLRRVDGRWRVVWSPSIIHPALHDGQRLAVVSETPPRQDIRDTLGGSLLRRAEVDVVGVYPGQLKDPEQTIDALVKTATIDDRSLDGERLLGRVRSAPPNAFLPLLMLQRAEHAMLTNRLQMVPGLKVKPRTVPVEPIMASELVGSLGPATAERLQAVGAPYQPGDTIGVSGIQFLLQRRLAGTPTVKVVAQDPNGARQTVLDEFNGRVEPQPVRLFLDRKWQLKAQHALSRLNVPASMVVVRANNGEVLGVANRLTDGKNTALEGRYPPGHPFGIVAAEGALAGGMTDRSETECPKTADVGGKTFTNEGGGFGKRNLQWHYALSCTTTLAQLSQRIDANTLLQAAGLFGFGKDWGLSVPVFSGYVPTPTNEGDKALVATGQGGVLVSPLSMALMAGAVASSTWRPPLLLSEPADKPLQPAQPLPAESAQSLKRMMQRSVASGTAKEAKLPGTAAPVYGVTDTVDYTERGQNKTVSWFVGFRGDVAFAIAVEGTVPAARIAKRFLTAPQP
jgi:cell division protein FtsI/penicillin-binding protein 2